MAPNRTAAADSGPIIHLGQVDRLIVFEAFPDVLVSREVLDEIGNDTPLPKNASIVETNPAIRDLAGLIGSKHGLGIGESSAIALCRHRRIVLLLSDDLEAREVARFYGLEPHGTLGLIARAYRSRIITRAEALTTVDDLRSNSSLYLTADLVAWVRKRIESSRS